jgi:hypothetical protein
MFLFQKFLTSYRSCGIRSVISLTKLDLNNRKILLSCLMRKELCAICAHANSHSLTHSLTHSLMELSPSWEAASYAVYGTRSFINVFTRALHRSLSWARSIQSIPSHPISLRSILILSTHLRLGTWPLHHLSLDFITLIIFECDELITHPRTSKSPTDCE